MKQHIKNATWVYAVSKPKIHQCIENIDDDIAVTELPLNVNPPNISKCYCTFGYLSVIFAIKLIYRCLFLHKRETQILYNCEETCFLVFFNNRVFILKGCRLQKHNGGESAIPDSETLLQHNFAICIKGCFM